jgi:hypothetical protein
MEKGLLRSQPNHFFYPNAKEFLDFLVNHNSSANATWNGCDGINYYPRLL